MENKLFTHKDFPVGTKFTLFNPTTQYTVVAHTPVGILVQFSNILKKNAGLTKGIAIPINFSEINKWRIKLLTLVK